MAAAMIPQQRSQDPPHNKRCNIDAANYSKIMTELRQVSEVVERIYKENYVSTYNAAAMALPARNLYTIMHGDATKKVSRSRKRWFQVCAEEIDDVSKELATKTGVPLNAPGVTHYHSLDRIRTGCLPYLIITVPKPDDGKDPNPVELFQILSFLEFPENEQPAASGGSSVTSFFSRFTGSRSSSRSNSRPVSASSSRQNVQQPESPGLGRRLLDSVSGILTPRPSNENVQDQLLDKYFEKK